MSDFIRIYPKLICLYFYLSMDDAVLFLAQVLSSRLD